MQKQLYKLSLHHFEFPPAHFVLDDPDGLIAIGGDLQADRLINAYQHGIFPWYSKGDPLLWWCPSTRATIKPEQVHISKSMAKFIRQSQYRITLNHDFSAVIDACAQPRKSQPDTWILDEMKQAYIQLHKAGYAHSVEVWDENNSLVGGLYGVAIGSVFCGESMFHQKTNASKLAFIKFCHYFAEQGGQLIDCQMKTAHLQSLGVTEMQRDIFLELLDENGTQALQPGCWSKKEL